MKPNCIEETEPYAVVDPRMDTPWCWLCYSIYKSGFVKTYMNGSGDTITPTHHPQYFY